MDFLLIILILLFMLLYPLLKIGFKMWLQMKQMKKSFRDAQQQYRGNYGGGSQQDHHRRGKVFGPEDGEYVDFEEIIEQRQPVQYVEVGNVEPRVTDAKFEEI